MLVQFSVENFLSIKEKVTFSMVASSDKALTENLIKTNKDICLKTTAIYGANGSGKSNLIKAINAVIFMIKHSNNRQPGDKLGFKPFAFDDEYKNKPSSFEFIMYIKNIKYVYGFSADQDKIYEEYLYYYPNGRQSLIFERSDVNKYEYTAEEKELKDIEGKNIDNKFFLATATSWNYEKTKPVYDFFISTINVIFEYNRLKFQAFNQYLNDESGDIKKFSLKLFNNTDISIDDYDIIDKGISQEQLNNFPPELRDTFSKSIKNYDVFIKHKVSLDKQYDLNFEYESLGTQNMFILAPIINYILTNGSILFVDELDKSLHPFLVRYIIKLFNNEETNPNGAQLIFNTHDTNLLDLKLFRRDQIWFTEKKEDQSTDLYPLDDFSVRDSKNINKGYIEGRYGAIPFIVMEDNITWQDK